LIEHPSEVSEAAQSVEQIEYIYELEELLGRKYVDGMKIDARFVDNPDIPKGAPEEKQRAETCLRKGYETISVCMREDGFFEA